MLFSSFELILTGNKFYFWGVFIANSREQTVLNDIYFKNCDTYHPKRLKLIREELVVFSDAQSVIHNFSPFSFCNKAPAL